MTDFSDQQAKKGLALLERMKRRTRGFDAAASRSQAAVNFVPENLCEEVLGTSYDLRMVENAADKAARKRYHQRIGGALGAQYHNSDTNHSDRLVTVSSHLSADMPHKVSHDDYTKAASSLRAFAKHPSMAKHKSNLHLLAKNVENIRDRVHGSKNENLIEGAEEHEKFKDHTQNPYHKTLTDHGFVHKSTEHRQNPLARNNPKADQTVHTYTHPNHGKSHVQVRMDHAIGGGGAVMGRDKGHSYIFRHEQSNGIMAPTVGDNKNQLHRSLSREYGVPAGVKAPKPTKWDKAVGTKYEEVEEPFVENAADDAAKKRYHEKIGGQVAMYHNSETNHSNRLLTVSSHLSANMPHKVSHEDYSKAASHLRGLSKAKSMSKYANHMRGLAKHIEGIRDRVHGTKQESLSSDSADGLDEGGLSDCDHCGGRRMKGKIARSRPRFKTAEFLYKCIKCGDFSQANRDSDRAHKVESLEEALSEGKAASPSKLSLSVQTYPGGTEAVAHWKASKWADKDHKSYTIHNFRHTSFSGATRDHETGIAHFDVEYHKNNKGKHKVHHDAPYPDVDREKRCEKGCKTTAHNG